MGVVGFEMMGHSFASNFSMIYHSIIQYMIGSQVQLIVGQALSPKDNKL
jgi:hypothetical protein